MNLRLWPYTIIMTVGPTRSGKTALATNIYNSLSVRFQKKVRYLSIDDFKREITVDPFGSESDFTMRHAANGAYKLMDAHLSAYTTYPINVDYVIIDSPGLDPFFRKSVFDLASSNGYYVYGLFFDIPEAQNFEQCSADMQQKILKHRRSYEYQKKSLQVEPFTATEIITDKNTDYNIELPGFPIIPKNPDNTVIIGDIHGCLDEFRHLVESVGADHYTLLGDVVDKGPDSSGVLRYIYENKHLFSMIMGNHERFCCNFFKSGKAPVDAHLSEYHDSIVKLKTIDRDLILWYEKNAHPAVVGSNYIATHAPCRQKHLGKNTGRAIRSQNYHYTARVDKFQNIGDYHDARELALNHIATEASPLLPYHFFGHEVFQTVFHHRNKFGVDTGCVHGNYLSAIRMVDSEPVEIFQVKSKQPETRTLDFRWQKPSPLPVKIL